MLQTRVPPSRRSSSTGVDASAFLQIVTLLATYDRRQSHVQAHPEDDKVPAVFCKRRDVLRLPLDRYRHWADFAEQGLARTVPFFHSHSIFRYRYLPYATQLVPLGAIFGWLQDRAESLRRGLEAATWCSADPVCTEVGAQTGQGPDSCNLAACHNCALVPETACEEFNRFLDRATLIGARDAPEAGFFNLGPKGTRALA